MRGGDEVFNVLADEQTEADAMHLAAQIVLAVMQRPDIATLALAYATQMIGVDVVVVNESAGEALH